MQMNSEPFGPSLYWAYVIMLFSYMFSTKKILCQCIFLVHNYLGNSMILSRVGRKILAKMNINVART